MKRHTLMKTAAVLITATAIPIAAMANVTDNERIDTVKVSIADLNLQNPAGQKVLYQRLTTAANKVCGPMNVRLAGSLSRAQANQQCYRRALDNVVDALNMPSIEALHKR